MQRTLFTKRIFRFFFNKISRKNFYDKNYERGGSLDSKNLSKNDTLKLVIVLASVDAGYAGLMQMAISFSDFFISPNFANFIK